METGNFEEIDKLLLQKEFSALTGEEKKLIEKALGQESYISLRRVIVASKSGKPVSSGVKKDLSVHFKSRNQHWSTALLTARIPAYLNLAVLAILVLTFWFFGPTREVTIEKPKIVQLPGKTDTLIVQSRPDTMFIEKLIKIEVPVYITAEAPEEITEPHKGSTLADQEELRSLLVSTK